MRRTTLVLALTLGVACGKSVVPAPAAKPAPDVVAPTAAASSAPQPPSSTRFVLRHATVIDVSKGEAEPDRDVVVDGDEIVAVVVSGSAPDPSARTVDARGKYVVPGLWDMHVHFADPDSGKLFIANGVTGVRVMWGNPPFYPGMNRFHFDLRDAYDSKAKVGPRMVIASQIIDGPKPFWPNSVAVGTAEEARKAVDDAKAAGVDFVKVYSFLPREAYFAIADESKKVGLPFAGHVPESVSVAEASDAGQKSMEHLMGLLVATSSREAALRKQRIEFAKKPHPDAEWWKFRGQQLDEAKDTYDEAHARALFEKLLKNGSWQCPTFTEEHNTASLDDPSHESDPRLDYVRPFTRRLWKSKQRPAREYVFMRALFEKKLALVRAMNAAGVPILAGTDEFNPYCFAGFGLHEELEWLVKAGLSPADALRAATIGPARFFDSEARMGSVEAGRVADLVILDADPLADIANTRKISAVVSRGTLFDRAGLDRMLDEVRTAASQKTWP